MSKEIIVKITIPESEYKKWNSFDSGGVNAVKTDIKILVSNGLKSDHIKSFEIEVEES